MIHFEALELMVAVFTILGISSILGLGLKIFRIIGNLIDE